MAIGTQITYAFTVIQVESMDILHTIRNVLWPDMSVDFLGHNSCGFVAVVHPFTFPDKNEIQKCAEAKFISLGFDSDETDG